MQVAAQTIGLDLVPVVPMAGPMGLLSYLDFTYEGGTVALGVLLQLTSMCMMLLLLLVADVLVAESRIDGETSSKSVDAITEREANVAGRYADAVLVAALEDHIPGFSGADANGKPMSREAGERTADKVMGLSLFSKQCCC